MITHGLAFLAGMTFAALIGWAALWQFVLAVDEASERHMADAKSEVRE